MKYTPTMAPCRHDDFGMAIHTSNGDSTWCFSSGRLQRFVQKSCDILPTPHIPHLIGLFPSIYTKACNIYALDNLRESIH